MAYKGKSPSKEKDWNIEIALSVLDKMAYAEKHAPEHMTYLEQYLEKYPEIKKVVSDIKAARENPAKTEKLVKDFKEAKKKSTAYRSEDDNYVMALAAIITDTNQSEYLTGEAKEVLQDNSRDFGGGSFGGAGASGTWSETKTEINDHVNHDSHGYNNHHNDHYDPPTYHDTSTSYSDSGSSPSFD